MANPLRSLLGNLVPGKTPTLSDKEKIAEILKLNPELLQEFETAYASRILSQEPDPNDPHLFAENSRQAADAKRVIDLDQPEIPEQCDLAAHDEMLRAIVNSLVSETVTWAYHRDTGVTSPQAELDRPALPQPSNVTLADINAYPPAMRPQLTECLLKKDMNTSTGMDLLSLYADANDPKATPDKRRHAYHLFRQGLDILDLDGIAYALLGTNPNAMSHWLPQLVAANEGKGFFKIPNTVIARVPLTLLQLTRIDWEALTPATLKTVDLWAEKVFGLDENETYFIKTGTFSSKFDFRNAKVTTPKEVHELGEYLIYIQHQATMMAGPLSQPSIYGASTTNEFVVREYIPDPDNNPTIYKGLPLRTEYRVFVDCDEKTVLNCVPYWDPETMKRRFGHEPDANSPHQIHDYITFTANQDALMARYRAHEQDVINGVAALLPDLDLSGQWSIDVMQSGSEFWLIDMALAEQSAYYQQAVPAYLRRPTKENWIPALPGTDDKKEEI